jgi:hypothetical protein
LPPDTHTVEARAWAATQTPRQWRLVSWRNGTNRPWRARFCAVRQEVLTAHFFMTQPHYLTWMLKLKDVEMRL